MCSALKGILAILLLSLKISTQPTSALLADDVASAAAANTVQDKFGLLKNAWTTLESVEPFDKGAAVILHKAIHAQLILNPLNLPFTLAQRRSVDEFYQEIRSVITWSYGRQLAEVMNINNNFNLNVDYLQSFVTAFEYDAGTALKIFEHAISALYYSKNTAELAQYLDVISFANPKSWELKVDVQLFLYFKYLKLNDINNEYLLAISFYFQAYKYHSTYPLSGERMHRLDKAMASLPATLLSAFMPVPPLCVRNAGLREYLFEKNDATNAAKPDIFTLPGQNFIGNVGHWELVPKAELDSRGFLYFTAILKNVLNQNYLYRDVAGGSKIVAWANTGVPTSGVWNLSVRNNYFVFAQGEYLMCGTTTVGADGRGVYAIKLPANTVPALCQWEVGTWRPN